MSSGGRGPFRVGISPVRACSTLDLLMVGGVDGRGDASVFSRATATASFAPSRGH
jgi:hypothetical protein